MGLTSARRYCILWETEDTNELTTPTLEIEAMQTQEQIEAQNRIDRQTAFGTHIVDVLGLHVDPATDKIQTSFGLKTRYGLVDLIKTMAEKADHYIASGRF